MTATTTDEKVERLREQLPATQHIAYFNTGTCGPLPASSVRIMIQVAEREMREGRMGRSGFTEMMESTARAMLSDIPGVDVITPHGLEAGLLHLTVDGWTPQQVTEALAAQNIIIRYVTRPLAARLSIGFYNTEEELAALRTAVTEIAETQPTPS